MSRNRRELLLVLLLGAAAAAAWSQEMKYVAFTPARRNFTCEVPPSWPSLEEDTPSGPATHLIGPADANGAWRAAIHVHYMQKGAPGFIPLDDQLKRVRRSDKGTDRESSPLFRWRVGRYPARRFEVVEQRIVARNRLPAQPLHLHHYYAFVPAGGHDYFVVKLSSTRDSYLEYRNAFDHLLNTFRVMTP
ncbi:MAG: hypothetical protein HY078_11135 [Elusimicrobia bacterium]|nr:hypothetical protein [Elusimicrobiota bacterium]